MTETVTRDELNAVVAEGIKHKRHANLRKQRILELIETQYGMVHGIALVINDEWDEMIRWKIGEYDGKATDCMYTIRELLAVCPDQEHDDGEVAAHPFTVRRQDGWNNQDPNLPCKLCGHPRKVHA